MTVDTPILTRWTSQVASTLLGGAFVVLSASGCGPDAAPTPTDPFDTAPAYAIFAGSQQAVTTNSADQLFPAVSGQRVVWQDFRNGNWDIYLADLDAGTETRLATGPAPQVKPHIDGDRVVWLELSDEPFPPFTDAVFAGVHLADLDAGTQRLVATVVVIPWEAPSEAPRLDGNRIVWTDRQDTETFNANVYVDDLGTGTTTQVSPNTANQLIPDISGDRVVWADRREDPVKDVLFMFDINTGTETRLSGPAKFITPRIDGNRVVWRELREFAGGSEDEDVYVLDLPSGAKSLLTASPDVQRNVAIDGDLAVWRDDRAPGVDLRGKDLSTGEEFIVTTNPESEDFPDLSATRVVWQDSRNGLCDAFNTIEDLTVRLGNCDIFTLELDESDDDDGGDDGDDDDGDDDDDSN